MAPRERHLPGPKCMSVADRFRAGLGGGEVKLLIGRDGLPIRAARPHSHGGLFFTCAFHVLSGDTRSMHRSACPVKEMGLSGSSFRSQEGTP